MKIIAIVLGFALDLLCGDPEGWPHPVILMGKIISKLEKFLRAGQDKFFKFNNKSKKTGDFFAGLILSVMMILLFYFLPALILYAADNVNFIFGLLLRVYWTWRILAIKSMADESRRVYEALKINKINNNINAARLAVSRIVGRDAGNLDAAGVTRAAVESVAESFTDGVISPMFYLFLGGAPLAMAFKAVSTMDSMIGYRTEKYMDFGKTAAKLDDLCNYIPARLAALAWIGAARLTGQDAKNAYAIWRRDGNKTDSPNAGQTEAACAGALGIQLGGPAVYFGEIKYKAYLGDDTREITPEDILRANDMLYIGGLIALIALIGVDILINILTRFPLSII